MKIDFSKTITNMKGDEIVQTAGENLTLGKIACDALLSTFPDEQHLSGEAKYKRFKLAELAIKCEITDIPSEDISEIKKIIGKAYGPLVVGRAYEVIEKS